MALGVNGQTRTTTGNFTIGNLLTHLAFRETAGAAASFIVRADSSGGRIVCQRNLLANESDDVEFQNPVMASDTAAPIFHLTVGSGAVSVAASGG